MLCYLGISTGDLQPYVLQLFPSHLASVGQDNTYVGPAGHCVCSISQYWNFFHCHAVIVVAKSIISAPMLWLPMWEEDWESKFPLEGAVKVQRFLYLFCAGCAKCVHDYYQGIKKSPSPIEPGGSVIFAVLFQMTPCKPGTLCE